jgi:hypothetical protein
VLVTVSCLGQYGRFGNQLFQYSYAKAYAEHIGAELHTPNWIGREIFEDVNEPIMQYKGDIDLFGYFQNPEHLALLSRSKLKKWFKFKNLPNFTQHDLVFHKRRGDFLNYSDSYAIVSDKSYTEAALVRGLDPDTALVLDDSRGGNYLLEDFLTMMHAKILFRANSTFSWWAATLGDCKVFAPKVEDKTGWVDVEFVEGNSEWSYIHNKYLAINP